MAQFPSSIGSRHNHESLSGMACEGREGSRGDRARLCVYACVFAQRVIKISCTVPMHESAQRPGHLANAIFCPRAGKLHADFERTGCDMFSLQSSRTRPRGNKTTAATGGVSSRKTSLCVVSLWQIKIPWGRIK